MFGFPQNFGEFRSGSICGDFVMLYALGGTNQRGIHQSPFEIFLHDFDALLDEAFHTGTFLALGALLERLENLLQSLHVAARLFKMLLEALFEFVG